MTNNKIIDNIKEKLKKIAPNLARKYRLDFLIIFGSYARSKARKNSDVDIGIKGNISFEEKLELFGEFSRTLGTNFIDVVDLSKASPLLAHTASREAVIIFEKEPGIFSEFRTETFKKFIETKSLRNINFSRTLNYIKNTSIYG